jgi:hypothetical protein
MAKWICVGVVLSIAACTGTRTGNPVMGGTATSGGRVASCDAVPKALDSFDTSTPLGFRSWLLASRGDRKSVRIIQLRHGQLYRRCRIDRRQR